jgi:hypothetical protein
MKIILTESQFNFLMEQKSVKSTNTLNQLGQSAKSIGNAYLNAGKNIANTASKTYDVVDKNIVSKIDPNIKNVVKKGASLIGSPSNASGYPSCIAKSLEKIGNNSVGQIRATPDGKQYSVALTGPIMVNYEGYQFYSDLSLMYPNGKMGKYTCGGKQNNPIVDGKEVDVSWAITYMKDPPTEYEKREAKKAQEFGDRFGKRILEPIHNFYVAHPTITTIGVSIIPIIGPWIAGALVTDQTVDAWNNAKTDEEKAWIALGAVCNLIFGMKLGMNASTSTVLKKVENATFKTIADKITSGKANELTTNEISILQEVGNNKTQITGLINNINYYKPKYIQKFGQQKYETLLGEFVSGKVDKNVFVNNLKFASGNTSKLANFSVEGGLKFANSEVTQLSNIASKITKGMTKDKPVAFKVKLNRMGKEIEITVVGQRFPGETFKGKALPGKSKIEMNYDQLFRHNENEILELLYHEAGHIKDPSVGSPMLNQKYDAAVLKAQKEYKNYEKVRYSGADAKELINAGDKFLNAKNKYVYHPQEIVANNQMVLNNITKKVNDLIKSKGGEVAKKQLDDVIGYASGKNQLTPETKDLLGNLGSWHLNGLAKNDKTAYLDFLKKITKQSEYLKSQINLLPK